MLGSLKEKKKEKEDQEEGDRGNVNYFRIKQYMEQAVCGRGSYHLKLGNRNRFRSAVETF